MEEALRIYQAAYMIVLDPVLLFNMARAQQKLGRPADAAESYRRFLNTSYDRDNLRERAEAGLSMTTAQLPPPTVAVVEPAAPPVTVVAAAPAPAPGPFYRRPWFWGVIGSVVAGAVTTGVTAGVLLSQQSPGAPSGTATIHPFM